MRLKSLQWFKGNDGDCYQIKFDGKTWVLTQTEFLCLATAGLELYEQKEKNHADAILMEFGNEFQS